MASGLDADTLDGIGSGSFLRSNATDTASGAITFTSSHLQLSGHWYSGFHANTNNYIHFYPRNHSGNATQTDLRAWNGSSSDVFRIVGGSATGLSWRGNTIWTAENDGSGSGLDSDTVDGIEASSFLRSDANDTSSGTVAFGASALDPDSFAGHSGGFGGIVDGSGWSARGVFVHGGGTGDAAAMAHNGGALYFGIQDGANTNSMQTWLQVTPGTRVINFQTGDNSQRVQIGGNKIFHAGNDGSGSGLDADLLDGVQGSSFLRSDATDTCSGQITFSDTIFCNKLGFDASDTDTFIDRPNSNQIEITVANKEVATFIDGSNNRPAMLIDKDQTNNGAGGTNYNSNGNANDLVVGNVSSNNHGITICTPSNGIGTLNFSDGSGGGQDAYKGSVSFDHSNEVTVLRAKTGNVVLRRDATDTLLASSSGITITGNLLPEANNTRNIGNGTTNFNSIWASTRFRGNDNVKLVLGNSQDFVIRHDGTNNIIGSPQGHNLHIKSGTGDNDDQLCAMFNHNSKCELYHNNIGRFETTSYGAFVSCTNQSDGLLVSAAIEGTVTVEDRRDSSYKARFYMAGSGPAIRNLNTNTSDNTLALQKGSTNIARWDGNGHYLPGSNNTFDIGSTSLRWRNIYTNDLNLSNEGGSNDVDGTWGSYTIQEGAEDLFLVNKRNGKKYKFNLTEVS